MIISYPSVLLGVLGAQKKHLRGGSRISGKWVHMYYKSVRVRLADFIYFLK